LILPASGLGWGIDMPCDYKDYPGNWKAIRAEIMNRAGDICEFVDPGMPVGKYPRCMEQHGTNALSFRGKVVLTIAHLCFTPSCDEPLHLRAYCQLHHNRYDAKHRAANRKKKREATL
jgi:hypothetical protein